jgi:hypothetical protein
MKMEERATSRGTDREERAEGRGEIGCGAALEDGSENEKQDKERKRFGSIQKGV